MNFAKSIENELDNFDIPSGGVTLPSGHQGGQLTIAGTGDHPSIGIFLPAVQNFKAAVNTFTTGNKKLQPKDLKLVCNKTQAADDDCDSEYRRLAFDLQSLVEGDGGGSLHVENGLNCLTATYVYVKNTALLGPAQQLALVTYSLIGLISARDTHEPLQNSKAIDRYLTTLNI